MKQSRLAQKRHAKKLKRKNKTYNPDKLVTVFGNRIEQQRVNQHVDNGIQETIILS